MRLKHQLLILVLSVFVPAFVAAILATGFAYTEEQAAQEQGMIEAARAFSFLVDNELQSKEMVLRTLANSVVLARGDLREFHGFAKRMAPSPETTIILIDRNDRQLLNTQVPFGAELPQRRGSNMNDLMKQYGAGKVLVSDIFFDPVGNQYHFTIQVPVILENEIRYFLVMGMNARQMQPLLVQQKLPPKWLGVIVDRKGAIVARSREPRQFVGRPADAHIQKLFASQKEGVLRSVTLDDIPVKTFFNRVPISDWTIVFSIPETELRRTPLRAAAFLALIMAAVLGVSLIIARRVGTRIVAHMDELEAAADKLGRGESVFYHPQGLVEVDLVGARIAQASKQIQQSKLELEQRVAQAVAETERAQRALLQSQKMEALGRLTGGIAHEFNNLLQTLTTAMQLARMVSNQERVLSLIDTCNKALKRATSLTGQLSAFGRIQEARQETVSLENHFKEFEQLVENILPGSVTLELDLADELWPVTIDPTQFELALINLAINARDAMASGGKITISANNTPMSSLPDALAPGDYVRIRVTDTGPGMTREVIAKALDPFFTTKKPGEGTGLGLPQAYGFARQSGGTLLLHSHEGQGTTVEIYLPKSGKVPTNVTQAQEHHMHIADSGRVLFVEDDPLVRESVALALENGGFQVLSATDADHALRLLYAGESVDVVFSDIVMPGRMSGIELAKVIRQDFQHAKIVLATGYSEQQVSIPEVQVLPKPYDITNLLHVLRQAVRTA